MTNANLPGFLFVLPWTDLAEIGGVNEAVINLWDEIERHRRFKPVLLVSSWAHPRPLSAEVDGRRTISWRMRFPWGPKSLLGFLVRLPITVMRARQFLTQENVAAVNIVFPELNALIFVVLRWLFAYRGKVFVGFQGTDIRNANASKGMQRLLWRFFLGSADACTAVSESMRREILVLCPRANVVTIYNGVDLDKMVERRGTVDSFAALQERPYILNVGAFIPRKGQDILIEAFARVSREFPSVRLVLVGKSGPFVDTIRHITERHGISDKVSIVQDIPHHQIGAFYEKATLFVLPSRQEGFSIALLEAAAFELPVIAMNVDGAPELISDGYNGRLFPPENVVTLAEQILDLLRSPEAAREMGKRNFRTVRDRFTWKLAYETYVGLTGVRNEAAPPAQ